MGSSFDCEVVVEKFIEISSMSGTDPSTFSGELTHGPSVLFIKISDEGEEADGVATSGTVVSGSLISMTSELIIPMVLISKVS